MPPFGWQQRPAESSRSPLPVCPLSGMSSNIAVTVELVSARGAVAAGPDRTKGRQSLLAAVSATSPGTTRLRYLGLAPSTGRLAAGRREGDKESVLVLAYDEVPFTSNSRATFWRPVLMAEGFSPPLGVTRDTSSALDSPVNSCRSWPSRF